MTRVFLVEIYKRNGAYLIEGVTHHLDPGGTRTSTGDFFDCASSIVAAKRVAKAMATKWGATGPWEWTRELYGAGVLFLTGFAPEDNNV